MPELDALFATEEWKDEIVTCFARRRSNQWTVVYADFSTISARGSSLHEAVDDASSQLVTFLMREGARRGPELAELKRPLEARRRITWELGCLVSRALSALKADRWLDVQELRMPLARAVRASEPVGARGAPNDDEESLMAEGYLELANELRQFANDSAASAAEVWPEV